MSDVASARCATCNTAWPVRDDDGCRTDLFDVCPRCGKGTQRSHWAPTFASFADAVSERNHILFEAYYEDRAKQDEDLFQRVEPHALAQYLMDAGEEDYAEREGDLLE